MFGLSQGATSQFTQSFKNLSKFFLFLFLGMGLSQACFGNDASDVEDVLFLVNNLWLLLATAMVFVMHLGFACLEASCVQPKNRINILFKNVFVISLGILAYALVGFNLMYPGESFAGGVFGFSGFGVSPGPDGLCCGS